MLRPAEKGDHVLQQGDPRETEREGLLQKAHRDQHLSLDLQPAEGLRGFEHRVAGADANPYLVIAAVIAAALDGIEAGKAPPPPLKGNAFDQDLPMLPGSWEQAIAAFRESDIPARTFPPQLAELFADAKAQEWDRFQSQMSDFELQSYLEVV